MNRLLGIVMLILMLNPAIAQVPQGIPYQAAARNSSGTILANQTIRVRFSIRDSIATGTIVYSETFLPTTTAQGLFSVNIGTGTATISVFSSINWGQNAKFMQVEMDPTGGTSYIDMGTQQMMSVPYALYSNNGLPAGTYGDILFHNGSSWTKLPSGAIGQNLVITATGIPGWSTTTSTGNVPSVSTSAVSNLTSSTFSSGGRILSDGGSLITAKGIVWSTSPAPSIALTTKTDVGVGIGDFNCTITGLIPLTTYYYRSYATNGLGTVYGAEIAFTTAPAIGVAYQGGIIGYILQPGDAGYNSSIFHGLIVAGSDQSSGSPWGYVCGGCFAGGTSTNIGTGAANTVAISYAWGSVTAAYVCDTLTLNGYTDWYLPSKDELNKMYLNRISIGGFSSAIYWSSSENISNSAWGQYFGDGYQNPEPNNHFHRVRAIRSF
jgi:hypothetical protein